MILNNNKKKEFLINYIEIILNFKKIKLKIITNCFFLFYYIGVFINLFCIFIYIFILKKEIKKISLLSIILLYKFIKKILSISIFAAITQFLSF